MNGIVHEREILRVKVSKLRELGDAVPDGDGEIGSQLLKRIGGMACYGFMMIHAASLAMSVYPTPTVQTMTGIIEMEFATPYSEGVRISTTPSVLSIFPAPTDAYFFDCSGRFFAAWETEWFIGFGLSGRAMARRWQGNRRKVRALKPSEVLHLDEKSKRVLHAAYATAETGEKLWFGRALTYDRAQDTKLFHSVYRPVGILPPDQYGACVVQVTEGCGWNRCHFCSFYRRQAYRLKEPREIKNHIERIAAFFGDGLSLRRSIFLGEANALGAPLEHLLLAMETALQTLVPRMSPFRGFYSFSEGSASSRQTAEFRALARLGLKRVYYGLETGQAALRETLGKPGSLDTIAESIENAKSAGVRVAVILLAGTGGRAWAKRHAEESVRFIKRLPLDQSDILFVSPLYGRDGTGEAPLTAGDMDRQVGHLRRELARKVRVAPYDIREFVY
jgi:hypothetical protein